MADARYLSCADTAKLGRKALAKAFPGIKFTVRSSTYSGGASIRVGWTDGPLAKQVEAVTSPYAGGGFDGMIDMAYSSYSWLMPDGTATFAKTRGTAGSMGTVPSDQQLQPSFKAELVRMGADYVFCEREYSEAFYRRAFARACERYGQDPASFKVLPSSFGRPYIDRATDRVVDAHFYMSDLVHQELSRRAIVRSKVEA